MPKAAPKRASSGNSGRAAGRGASRGAARGANRSYEEILGGGWMARVTDRIVENPAQSGGILVVVVALVAIVSNAAFLQHAHHPDPFFVTRPDDAAPAVAGTPGMLLPRSRADVSAAATPVSAQATLVQETQRALQSASLYSGPVDGMLGPATKAAVANFEKKLGLDPTGQPSPRLLIQIRKGIPHNDATAPATTGSIDDAASQARTKRIQQALNSLGYGPVAIDGRNGGKTATAIRRFELDNGLALSGVASDAVMAKMVMIGAINPS